MENENKHVIQGITCDVTNCVYHGENCTCDAGKVEIGPGYANCCSDTNCSTFQPRNNQ